LSNLGCETAVKTRRQKSVKLCQISAKNIQKKNSQVPFFFFVRKKMHEQMKNIEREQEKTFLLYRFNLESKKIKITQLYRT
jgi:hypothetical protein